MDGTRATIAVMTDIWPESGRGGIGSFVAGEVRALGSRYRQVVLVPRLVLPRAHRRLWGPLPGFESQWEQPSPPARLLCYPMLRVPRGGEVGPRVLGARLVLRRTGERPALVHGHFLRSVAPAAVSIARRFDVPAVVTAHGTDARWLASGGIQDRFRVEMREACRAADRVIAVSRPIAEQLAAVGVPAERIATIPMGIDERFFQPSDRAAARRALGVRDDVRLIAFVGGATGEKGFGILAQALERLPGVRCLAAGAGPLSSPRIERLGPLDAAGVGRCLAAADLLCLPSLSEGSPVSIMEALASGRPVVASAVGGIPDQIVSGQNGLLVAAGDPIALAAAIGEALERSWSVEAIRRSSEPFWWSRIAPRIAELYDELLEREPSR